MTTYINLKIHFPNTFNGVLFLDELPEENLDKNSYFEEEANLDDDFEFNQDFEIEESTRSPGWLRYQKRIK